METELKTIGILNPGAMGGAVAQTMVNSGHEVLWVSAGRSDATRQRAEAAGLVEVDSLEEMLARAAAIVSVCPPHAAEDVADAVVAVGFQGAYLDANAISPAKSVRIGEKLTAAGIMYTDGSIIGGPPTKRGTTWLYLSGPHAAEAEAWFAAGPLETEVVNGEIGSASGLKMCFAANTKARNALQTAILGAAESLGVREVLERQWDRYEAGATENMHRRTISVAHNKAWRFIGEMEEMVETYRDLGLPTGYFEAAAETYRRVAHLRDAPEPPSAEALARAVSGE